MQIDMEVRNKRRRILLPIIAVAVMIALCFAVLIFGSGQKADAATSGSIVDYNETEYVTVNLDVNGLTSTTNEQTSELFATYDGSNQGYRQRRISIQMLINSTRRDELDGYYLESYSNEELAAGARNLYNYSENYFYTKTPSANAGVGYNYYPYVDFIALKSTDSLPESAWPRIALKLTNGTEEVIITVRVHITAKFCPTRSSEGTGSFFVGRQIKDSIDATSGTLSQSYLGATENGYKSLPVKFTNYTTVEIDLEDYLKNRQLYAVPADGSKGKKDRVYADKSAERTAGVLEDTEKYLVMRDLSSFHIVEEPAMGSLITKNNVKFFTDTINERRSFTVTLNITSQDLNNPGNFDSQGNLWDTGKDDGPYFELDVKIALNSGSDTYTVKIPIVFSPSDAPKRHAEFTMDTSLNAGTTVRFPDVSFSSVGFKTVKVTPEYLCDYVSLSTNKMYFVDSAPQPVTSGVVDVTSHNVDGVVYYEVTAISNGSTDVIFSVNYNSGETYRQLDIPVTFVVYGSYSLTFDIKGTDVHNYTINSTLFEALKNDGYQIVGANILKFNEDTAESYAQVSYSNGTISVTPQHSVSYDNVVGVKVALVDMEGHRIELDCGMTINLTAKDPFATWLPWQKVLFWVGIGIAAALLILLIVWLFLRSIHRRKIDELETSAPTSAYIIKLNSTIAAAQAQQKGPAPQPFAASQGQMMIGGPAPQPSTPAPPMPGAMPNMLAGANPAAAADPAGTLALGVTPQMSSPTYSTGGGYPNTGELSTPISPTTATTSATDDIYIPLSDEELLLRIYEEKFEPRGMLKRTFDKSKDLQQRELEKEKARIRDDVRGGMTIEEACKSTKQREAEAAAGNTVTGDRTVDTQPVMQLDPLIMLLGFDPNDPIVSDFKPQEISDDLSEEQKKLKVAENNNQRLHAELAIIESRLDAIGSANTKTESDLEGAQAIVESLNNEMRSIEQKLDDKNMALATERRKAAKESLAKEIADLDSRVKTNKDAVAARRTDIESYSGILARLKEINDDYAGKKEFTEALVASSDQELAAAQEEVHRIEELAAKAKRQQELNAKLEILKPMMVTVNTLEGEMNELTEAIERSSKDKDSLKTKVGTLQSEMLSTTDSGRITELNAEIKSLNKEISDLDRATTANTNLKTNKNIEMTSVRRKANEFIEKEEIELEDVVKAEDQIIGKIALDKLLANTEAEKARAEENVAHWQAECDSLTENLDNMVMEAVAGVATRVKESEDALAEAQTKLEGVNAAIESSEDDEEKLNLSVEQMALQEEIATISENLENMRAEGIKANLEFRQKGEDDIEHAREELERAKQDFEQAVSRFDDASTNVNPLDLIVSGSGVISGDRKKIEAENLKKLLKESQNAAEQAKIQARMAQEEAERAVADAKRASDESKAEAERMAQEAMEKAEAAREEAEQRAREEAERAREEAEQARLEAEEFKRQAQEEVENARRAAEEEAERARKEAEEEQERMRLEMEEHKRQAEEEAERARKEAEEEAERARKEAEEEQERMRLEMEEHKRQTEEEAERARKEAEEESERVRKEAEEAAKLAEEEAAKQAEEAAARKARIDEKVTKRKEEITKLRDELKNVTDEEQGNALREKFYQMQLALDEDEKSSQELNDLLAKSMDDASHAAELSRYKKLANQKPRRIVKKVTERVNRVPKKKPGAHGARPNGAKRPAPGGKRPAGARPNGAKRPAPGGKRPAGSRPNGARPGSRPTHKK